MPHPQGDSHVSGVTLNQFSVTSNDQVVGIKGLSNIVESDGIAKVWVGRQSRSDLTTSGVDEVDIILSTDCLGSSQSIVRGKSRLYPGSSVIVFKRTEIGIESKTPVLNSSSTPPGL